ncbi:MAG TPA: YihY/virulence factor BrkB family protein [Opitutaceae bacterium]|nr:YihY/virulence factor BrkB family protein [Opitutaceae bacterium]
MGSPPPGNPASSAAAEVRPGRRARLVHIIRREIWQSAVLKDRSPRGILYAILRVGSITVTVFSESRVTSRAAALSFSSLLGLGPLIAIGVLIGGFMLGKNSDQVVADQIGRVIELVAPQLNLGTTPNAAAEPPATGNSPPTASIETEQASHDSRLAPALQRTRHPNAHVNPDVVRFVSGIIAGARSGSGGVFGAISFIIVVLLLFKSIEDAFNDIWGVRTGRSVVVRVVFYWTVLTLGAVIFFAAIALLGAGAFVNVFKSSILELPGGHELLSVLQWSLPLFSIVLLVGLLMLAYRLIPNTKVFWGAAFVGALVVTTLLLLNNFVALLYVRRVILTRSLYGSVALPLVLMLGLFVFWLYLLIGGIVSYAVQNVNFRNSQAAWSMLTEHTRERLSLVVFLAICRRFRECQPALSASELSAMLKVPTQLVNECLGRLEQLKLVLPLQPDPSETENDVRFQPARPLNRTTLFDFKTLDDNFGENPLGSSLEHVEPLLARYDAALASVGESDFFRRNLDELFAEP